MSKITVFLQNVRIGQPQTYANMQVFPLNAPNGHPRAYQTLDQALASGEVKVLEMSAGGSVPTLSVENGGIMPVLLVMGEELVGAKQNRVLNTSILVPAHSTTPIPVSCVEQGRWAYSSRTFRSGATTSHSKLRKEQMLNVTQNLRSRNAYDADQAAVWREVGRKMSSHSSHSQTHALHDLYEQTQGDLQGYLNAFVTPVSAQGMLIVINGEVFGGDVFDHADTLQQLWGKLLQGYALDALERREVPATQKVQDAHLFLNAALQADTEVYQSVGLGEDVRLTGEIVTGSSLIWEETAIHTALFNPAI